MSIFQGLSVTTFGIIQVQGLWSPWVFVSLSSVVVLITIVRIGLSWRTRSQALCVVGCLSLSWAVSLVCSARQSPACATPREHALLTFGSESSPMHLVRPWHRGFSGCAAVMAEVKLPAQGMRDEWICLFKSQTSRLWGSAIAWGCDWSLSSYADLLVAYLVLCLSTCVCSWFNLIK